MLYCVAEKKACKRPTKEVTSEIPRSLVVVGAGLIVWGYLQSFQQ